MSTLKYTIYIRDVHVKLKSVKSSYNQIINAHADRFFYKAYSIYLFRIGSSLCQRVGPHRRRNDYEL